MYRNKVPRAFGGKTAIEYHRTSNILNRGDRVISHSPLLGNRLVVNHLFVYKEGGTEPNSGQSQVLDFLTIGRKAGNTSEKKERKHPVCAFLDKCHCDCISNKWTNEGFNHLHMDVPKWLYRGARAWWQPNGCSFQHTVHTQTVIDRA